MIEVGGYYDAEDLAGGPWRTYRAIEKLAPGSDNHIVIGPWSHGGWSTRGGRSGPESDGNSLGNLHWSTKTGPWFRDSIEFPFYMHYLKDAPMAPLPEEYARVPNGGRAMGPLRRLAEAIRQRAIAVSPGRR